IGGLLGEVDVRLVRIGFMSIVLAAAPSHPLALLPKPVAIEDVREHTQLVVSDQSERTKGRDFGVFAYRTWRLTDPRTKHTLMREGLGWGGLPRWLIADDLASGRLVELDLEPYREVRSSLYAMHRNDRSPKPVAAWLIDQFKRQLGCFNEMEPGAWTEEEPETSRP
ncbi:MAG: LysR family transcriptional regulator, partial [Mesorhizobium sp.]